MPPISNKKKKEERERKKNRWERLSAAAGFFRRTRPHPLDDAGTHPLKSDDLSARLSARATVSFADTTLCVLSSTLRSILHSAPSIRPRLPPVLHRASFPLIPTLPPLVPFLFRRRGSFLFFTRLSLSLSLSPTAVIHGGMHIFYSSS